MSNDLSIKDRHAEIIKRIADAAKSAGRASDEVTLVAVSKQQTEARVKALLGCGQIVFGENRVQEARTRWGETFAGRRAGLELRLIGPLQTNKAVEAVALFDVIETVDREKLIKALLKAADKAGRLPRLYVQVNTGEETQKSGVIPSELPSFLTRLKSEYNIIPEGLMCIPPLEQAASPHFWFLSNLARDNDIAKLSMGMSGDYETAIKMGATSVRVGSALLGDRDEAARK